LHWDKQQGRLQRVVMRKDTNSGYKLPRMKSNQVFKYYDRLLAIRGIDADIDRLRTLGAQTGVTACVSRKWAGRRQASKTESG